MPLPKNIHGGIDIRPCPKYVSEDIIISVRCPGNLDTLEAKNVGKVSHLCPVSLSVQGRTRLTVVRSLDIAPWLFQLVSQDMAPEPTRVAKSLSCNRALKVSM